MEHIELVEVQKKYADDILAELEANLQDKLDIIKDNRKELK